MLWQNKKVTNSVSTVTRIKCEHKLGTIILSNFIVGTLQSEVQSNSVITSKQDHNSVRYSRKIIITVKIYVVCTCSICQLGPIKVSWFIITVIVTTKFDCSKRSMCGPATKSKLFGPIFEFIEKCDEVIVAAKIFNLRSNLLIQFFHNLSRG